MYFHIQKLIEHYLLLFDKPLYFVLITLQYPTLPGPMPPENSTTKLPEASRFLQRGKSGWKGVKLRHLADLAQKIKKHFKWDHTPREFQVEAIKAQLLRKDVMIHAGTGSGKTAIVAGPFAHEDTKGMVTLLVSPLISLQEEQVRSILNLQAVAVHDIC